MNEQKTERSDPLIDQVRETRQRLVREHGGLHGWVKYLQQLQSEHPEKLVSRSKQVAD